MSRFHQTCKRIRHPCLRPTHIRNAHRMKTATLMIEESAAVAQVFDRPLRYLFSQNHRAWNVPTQLDQGYDRWCGRMHVSRIESIGIVLRPTVIQEKAFLPEFVATTQSVIQL